MNKNQSITKLGKHFFSCKRRIKELRTDFMIPQLLMDEGKDKECIRTHPVLGLVLAKSNLRFL